MLAPILPAYINVAHPTNGMSPPNPINFASWGWISELFSVIATAPTFEYGKIVALVLFLGTSDCAEDMYRLHVSYATLYQTNAVISLLDLFCKLTNVQLSLRSSSLQLT